MKTFRSHFKKAFTNFPLPEKYFVKAFSSLESMALLLDILYSCLFAADYDRRYSYKINLSKATEFRSIDNGVIREE